MEDKNKMTNVLNESEKPSSQGQAEGTTRHKRKGYTWGQGRDCERTANTSVEEISQDASGNHSLPPNAPLELAPQPSKRWRSSRGIISLYFKKKYVKW